MAPSHPSPNRGTKGRGARRPRFDPGSLPTCSTGCRPIDEAGPCAEGTKIPSVVPGGRRAEGLHTQSVPGHKVEVMGLGCQAPRAASYVGAPCAAGGGRRRLWLQPKKKETRPCHRPMLSHPLSAQCAWRHVRPAQDSPCSSARASQESSLSSSMARAIHGRA